MTCGVRGQVAPTATCRLCNLLPTHTSPEEAIRFIQAQNKVLYNQVQLKLDGSWGSGAGPADLRPPRVVLFHPAASNSCAAMKVQSIILSLMLTQHHTHDHCSVCVTEEGVHPSDMESLAALEHNNGRIEGDVAPRGLAWMEGYVGVWGVMGMFLSGGGFVMHIDPDPCSCRLARSSLGEKRQLTSVPSVLLWPIEGASVIVEHLEGGKMRGGAPTTAATPPNLPTVAYIRPSVDRMSPSCFSL
ncbi:hypothetical protein Q5P01_013010 [Channa striata]|uniref:Uncharacterized protein n=1 Tax=Channa striata TaxID=64152 RepID=A0AA88MQV5_CHASR|nr:hypothetical protein Q5P01_013010 [Channa striata]